VLALLLVPAGSAQARTVRVFAMQPKLDLAWMESRQTYHDKMFALADRRLRAAPAPRVQTGQRRAATRSSRSRTRARGAARCAW
jgi:hypothetical protein